MPSRRLTRRPAGSDASSDDLTSFEESFRILRSNLTVALADLDQPAVIVTSANAGEGKTTTACGLATAFAAAGSRVILVDLDLRRPAAHRVVGAHNEFGVSDVLLGRRSLADALQFVQVPPEPGGSPLGLYFLAGGGGVASPADLLAGAVRPGCSRGWPASRTWCCSTHPPYCRWRTRWSWAGWRRGRCS